MGAKKLNLEAQVCMLEKQNRQNFIYGLAHVDPSRADKGCVG